MGARSLAHICKLPHIMRSLAKRASCAVRAPAACSKAERMEPSTQQIVESVLLAQKQNPYHAEEAWVWFSKESAAHNPKKVQRRLRKLSNKRVNVEIFSDWKTSYAASLE